MPSRSASSLTGLVRRALFGRCCIVGLGFALIGAAASPALAQQADFRGEARPDPSVIVNLSVIERLLAPPPELVPAPVPTPVPPPAAAAAPAPTPVPIPAEVAAAPSGEAPAPAPDTAPQSTLMVPGTSTDTATVTPTPVPVPTPSAPPPAPDLEEDSAAPEPVPTPEPSETAATPEPAPTPESSETAATPEPETPAAAEDTVVATVDLTAVDTAGVARNDDGLSVLFTKDSQNLPATAESALSELADRLNADPSITLKLLGYSEPIGDSASKPRRLSLFRALAVRTYLLKQGIDSRRMTVQALGTKDSHEDRPPNRVDLVVSQN